ncbi:hypothetical protein CEP53_006249 [Fusarium sp. AF-6]|nr:hypothetical protein CEP53_006249 [Fusarium sp. AF-6]
MVVRFQPKANTGAKPVDDEIDDRGQSKPQIKAHRTAELIPVEEAPTTQMANDLPAALAVQAALKAVQEAIDRLQRLGSMIRRSSTVTIASRVKNYALKSDAAENDEFNKLILLRHTIAFTKVQLARKLTRSVLSSPRKESICPLCNQNVSKIHDPMIESKVEGKETLRFAKRQKKARFGDLADSLSLEEEASSRQPNHLIEPELGTDDTTAAKRQKLAIHVASHLKALSFLSIRYMESDSESVKSEDAALVIDNDASDQDQLSDIFPLSDGPLDFQDIPLDDRPVNDGGSGDQDTPSNFLESRPVSSPNLPSFFPLVDGLADAKDDVDRKWRYIVDNNLATKGLINP